MGTSIAGYTMRARRHDAIPSLPGHQTTRIYNPEARSQAAAREFEKRLVRAPLLLRVPGRRPREPLKRDFEADAVGLAARRLRVRPHRRRCRGQWVVRVEKGATTNHVLVQESADPTDYRFPVAVLKEGAYKDVVLSVRARPLSGEVDQGFGLVWRYKDVNNYYITRCNADEDNCTIYHTVKGRRRAVPEPERQGRQEHLAHAEARGRRRPLRRDLRREQGPRRQGRDFQGCGEGRALDQGGLGDRVRRSHGRGPLRPRADVARAGRIRRPSRRCSATWAHQPGDAPDGERRRERARAAGRRASSSTAV